MTSCLVAAAKMHIAVEGSGDAGVSESQPVIGWCEILICPALGP